MPVRLKVDFDGDEALNEAIQEIDFKARQPRPFLLQYGAYMRRIPARSVREQADPVTLQAWPIRKGLSLSSRRGDGGNALADTGQLVRSFNAAPAMTDDSVTIGSALVYARIHQVGGIIRAKKKYLTIPLSVEAAKKFSGIRAWFAAKKAAKQSPHFFRSKSGSVFAAASKGKKKKEIELGWLLVPQVRIPQRRYLGFGKRDKEKFIEMARAFFSPRSRKG